MYQAQVASDQTGYALGAVAMYAARPDITANLSEG
jgi:hypothetical protein